MIIWGDKVVNSEARQILEAVKAGSMSIDDALLEIKKSLLRILDMQRWIYTEKSAKAQQK